MVQPRLRRVIQALIPDKTTIPGKITIDTKNIRLIVDSCGVSRTR
jgi:hypothetical protein